MFRFNAASSSEHSTVTLHGPPSAPGGDRPDVKVDVKTKTAEHALNLFSRASCVVPAQCEQDFSEYGMTSKSEYVVKIYFPDESRSHEAENLAKVYEIAAGDNGDEVRGHVPILLAERTWRDLSADRIEKILGITRKGLEQRKRFRNLCILLVTKLYPISNLSGLDFIKALRSSFRCA